MIKKIELPNKVTKLINKFEDAGGEIFVVGGAVRDMLLGKKIKDWDFATNLVPEEMKKIFPKNSFCNNAFGTLSIVGKDKEIFEVTTYRTERGYSDKRHPDKLSWSKKIEEDLARRDFTINALAWGKKAGKWKMVDLFEGEKDLKNKKIRAVGDAEVRFSEDALRMMRAVRLAVQLGFEIEEKTKKAIIKNAKLIKEVAGERIRDELFLILLSPAPAVGIDMLRETGLLEYLIPELLAGIGMGQKGHHIYDVWEHNLRALQNCQSDNPITRLAALLHDVDKPVVVKKNPNGEKTFHNHEVSGARTATAIGKRLRLSKKELDMLFKLTRWHMFTASETQTDKSIRRFIRRVTLPLIDEMIALRRADRLGSGSKETSWRWELFKKRIVEVQKQPFSIKDLKVNGEDVMKLLKIKPGPKVGEVLNKLFAMVEEKPELNEREGLLKEIKKEK